MAHGIILPVYASTNSSSYGFGIDNGTGTGDGIRGYSGSTGYNYAGVYAVCNGGTSPPNGGTGVFGASRYGYGGYFQSNKYRGLYATGDSLWYAGYFVNPKGSDGTGLFVNGTLWVTGAKTGYVVDLAQNDGPETLEPGDLVVITGYSSPIVGERIPIVKVSKARTAESGAVAGVVDDHYIITTPFPAREPAKFDPMKKDQAVQSNDAAMIAAAHGTEYLPHPVPRDASKPNGTSIGAGEYLSMVTLGAFLTVKVDASFGAIQAGDLLVSSPNPGYAMRSASPKTGTVVGKALGSLGSGTGTIPVLVTLH